MSPSIPHLELSPAVRHLLDAARRRLRAYVWLEGLAALVLVLGAAFWLGLALDWLFEPSPAVRQVALYIIGATALYILYRSLLRRACVAISDTSLAVLLERRFPKLGDHVLTAVHVASSPELAATYHPDLIAQTHHAAAEAVADVQPAQLFHRGPLVRALLAALAIALSIFVFAIASRDVFGFYLQRMALSPDPWPRRVHLEVVGFPMDAAGARTHKLAQDDRFELLVHARTDGYEIPAEIEIRYKLADGRRGRDTLSRVGEAVPGRDAYQLFRYEFERVVADMTFDVVGGDDRVEELHLTIVDRPQLFSIDLACDYPKYLGRKPQRLPVTGGMRIPEGTDLVLHAQSTKPLQAAQIHITSTSQEATLRLPEKLSDFRWKYGSLRADDVLLVAVTDTDGVSTREPYRLSLAVVADELPQVVVRLSGIGAAITPEAVIPLVGKITDDHGLKQIWYEYQINEDPLVVQSLALQPDGELTVSEFDRFDLRATDSATGTRVLTLKPGQKLRLTLKATDRYDLANMSREGRSQSFVLDVVSEGQLLAFIERRELELRQRYEAIYEKMTDMRNLLSRIEFAKATSDEDQETSESTAAQSSMRHRLRLSGAEQNVMQSADEILAVAEGFDDIHDQLSNNRVDNSDLKNRLHEQIALPLHTLGSQRMPGLSAKLKLVEQHLEDAREGEPALAAAVTLADEILVDMKQVLDRMIELETYNEVVELLRGIITDQEELNRRTKERQRERFRNLLEE